MKVLSNSVTITTAAWGDYWNQYGEQWSSYILRLDPQPTEVIIVSDKPIKTDFKVVIELDCNLGVFRNVGVKASTSTWVVPSDLDDEPLPNYIDNLDDSYDIICYSFEDNTGSKYCGSNKTWDKIFNLKSKNPLVSCSAVKKELLMKYPYRKIGWEDWALWLDLKSANASVKFDQTIRYRYQNNENSLSKQDVNIKNEEIYTLKKLLCK
jgi:hypothetical protein